MKQLIINSQKLIDDSFVEFSYKNKDDIADIREFLTEKFNELTSYLNNNNNNPTQSENRGRTASTDSTNSNEMLTLSTVQDQNITMTATVTTEQLLTFIQNLRDESSHEFNRILQIVADNDQKNDTEFKEWRQVSTSMQSQLDSIQTQLNDATQAINSVKDSVLLICSAVNVNANQSQ
jgi:hypothetical protein